MNKATVFLILGTLVGAGLTFYPPTWKFLTHLITFVHELGHAFIGLVTGSKVLGIKLQLDSSGVTTSASSSVGAGFFFGRMLTLLAGYPAPMVAASLFAFLGTQFSSHTVWLSMAIASGISLIFMRNLLAVTVCLAFSGISVLAYAYADDILNAPLLAILLSIFFIGGVRRLRDTMRLREHRQDEGSDMQALRTLTMLPARFWEFVMWALAVVPLGGLIYFTFFK